MYINITDQSQTDVQDVQKYNRSVTNISVQDVHIYNISHKLRSTGCT